MDIAILKVDKIRFLLPGLFRKEKSVDTILDVDKGNYSSAGDILEKVRFEVADYCTQKQLSNSRDNIRANCFLPTMNHDFRGHTFVLKMPPMLMKNMKRVQEHDMYFCLGQGATGYVYETGTHQFTRTKEHRIPDYLAEKVEPALNWWATFPLKSAEGKILAVLNVDGLAFDLPKEEEVSIKNIVSKYLKDIGEVLDKEPKKDIFVLQKRHNK